MFLELDNLVEAAKYQRPRVSSGGRVETRSGGWSAMGLFSETMQLHG